MSTNVDIQDFSNAILDWGKTYLLTPEAKPYLSEIGDYCKICLESSEIERFLPDLTKDIKMQVESAIITFSNPELIFATEEDNIWYEAQEAFIVFDRINYLSEGIHYLKTLHKTALLEKIMKDCNEIMSGILEWLEDGNFSPLRLTVLNDIRRKYLARIPENNHYLFPWYEIYSDLDENILRIIMENLAVFQNIKEENVPEALESYMGEISYELNRDKELYSMLKRHFVLHKSFIKSFSKRSAITLWRLGEKAALDYIVPQCVEEAGLIRVSDKVIGDVDFSTKTNDLFWTFMSSFCGPGLNEKQRVTLLGRVEKMLKNVKAEDITGVNSEVLKPLKLWFDGKCEDSQLVNISFTTWNNMLQKKVESEEMPLREVDENPGKLWNTINEKISSTAKITPLYDRQPVICEPKIAIYSSYAKSASEASEKPSVTDSPIVTLHSNYAMAASETATQQMQELRLYKNPISFSLKPDTNGEYPVLPINNVLSCDAPDDYQKVWEYLELAKDNYWGGYAITRDNKPEVLTVQQVERRIFKHLESKYKKAFIGISPKKPGIEAFIQGLSGQITLCNERDVACHLEEFIRSVSKQMLEGEIQPQNSFITESIILIISLEVEGKITQ